MRIGILSKNYAAKRLFLNKLANAIYKDIRFYNYYLWKNAHLWFLKIIGKLNMSPEEQASKLFYDYKAILPTKCDLYHFFNTINYSKKQPWVISVESGVPWPLEVIRCVESSNADLSSIKNNRYVKRALYYLSLPNCRGLIALSKCSQNIQLEILNQFPEYKEQIVKKLITLYPPQDLIIKSISEKINYTKKSKKFTFIYVGRDFFRKGGRETLQVLSELKKKYDFNLILISNLRIDEIKYLRSSHDIEDTKKLINDNLSWIEFHESLPNNEVLEKIKQSNVALLPTWMDTYGYSVIECQACGTPVISTSLRALTETNDDKVGWLIKVPVNKLNTPIHNTKEEQDIFHDTLSKELYKTIEYVLLHTDEVQTKSQNCLKRIEKYHDPQKYAKKLDLIYNNKISELRNNV